MVPPRWPMPRTESRVSETTSSSPSSPANPRFTPSTSQLRLWADSTAARITAFSPGAALPPSESPTRSRSWLEQLQAHPWPRVPVEPGLLEDRLAIADDLEASLPRRDESDLRVGILCANLGRQTDGPWLV